MIHIESKEINHKKSIVDKFINIAKKNNNKTKEILLLVSNNSMKLFYDKEINLEYSEELNINTYLNFIKKEIYKYWPLISDACSYINTTSIAPMFVQSSLSEYIITEEVKKSRKYKGYFEDITSTDRNIAMSIINNINSASYNLVEFKEISKRIHLSKKNMNLLNDKTFVEMNEIIENYILNLLSKSILDNALSVYVYNKYLLSNPSYSEILKKQINYLIVDSLEHSTPAEINLIKVLEENIKESYIYFDGKKDFSNIHNVDMNYIQENIKIEELKYINENVKLQDIYSMPVEVNLSESSQLYNDMIEDINEKLVELINEGKEKKDIVVITPINNSILDTSIKNKLSRIGVDTFNTKKDKKLIDYNYSRALLTALAIFYNCTSLITDEDNINLIETLLEVNKLKAYKILNKVEENKEYKEIIEYIKEKKNEDIRANEFMMKFYIDKMLHLKEGKENVAICKKIINESMKFLEAMNLLNIVTLKNKEEIFIECLKSNINDYYSVRELESLRDEDKILITTPYTYISSQIHRPIQIWVDIGSNTWNMKLEKEISNPIVLRNSYKEGTIFTDDMEEFYKKYYLYNTIYNLIRDAKKLYAYKSEYTINGYIQESMLYGLLLKVKGDRNE